MSSLVALRVFSAVSILSVSVGVAAPGSAQDENNLVYHVFVRSFADSDDPDHDNKKVGDLKGLAAKLDSHLNDGQPETDHDLEVGILWLMPVFPADSYHGYNVQDYRAVSPELGTLDDLKQLIEAAHQRGVRIMLDLPINHTSNNHAWFQAAVAGDAAMRERYHFRSAEHNLTDGWHETEHNGVKVQYFGLFDRSMPDLNFDNEEVQEEVEAIAKFWLDLGVDGFRLDAAKHIYGDSFGGLAEPQILKNNDWWLEFTNHCYATDPQAVLVGEVLGGRETLRRHSYGLEALLDEPFMHDARNQMGFPQPGFVGRLKEATRQAREVNGLAPHAPDRSYWPFLFVGSHDENPRLASKLEQLKQYEMAADVGQAYRVGMYMLLAMAKYPVIYYGEEVMQRGWKWNGFGDGSGVFDETLREPFPWTKAGNAPEQTTWFAPRFDQPNDGVSREEQDAEGGMLHLVRGITNLRTKHPGFANGELGEVLTDTHDWMVFERFTDQDRYLVLINPTGEGKDYHFHDGWYPRYFGARLLFWSDGQSRQWKDESQSETQIERKVFVPPYGLVVLKKA